MRKAELRLGTGVIVRPGIYLPFGLKSRKGVIVEKLPPCASPRMVGVRFAGHPNVTDYLPRELSKSLHP